MPKLFHIKDNQTGRVLVRKSLDAREMLGTDPSRYSPVGDAARLGPIRHPKPPEDEGTLEPVPAVAAKHAPPATVQARKPPSPATSEKRKAALARGRATAAANRAAKAQAQPAA